MKSQRISIASNQENAKVCRQRVLCWRLWTKFISNDDERRVLVAWTIKQLFILLNFVHFLQESIAGKGNKINSKNMATDRRKSNENAKRQAEESPNNAPTRKRSALGDMTNVRWYWIAASAYFLLTNYRLLHEICWPFTVPILLHLYRLLSWNRRRENPKQSASRSLIWTKLARSRHTKHGGDLKKGLWPRKTQKTMRNQGVHRRKKQGINRLSILLQSNSWNPFINFIYRVYFI